jgi:hypothetical protein
LVCPINQFEGEPMDMRIAANRAKFLSIEHEEKSMSDDEKEEIQEVPIYPATDQLADLTHFIKRGLERKQAAEYFEFVDHTCETEGEKPIRIVSETLRYLDSKGKIYSIMVTFDKPGTSVN